MPDPLVVAAIVSASGGVLEKVIEVFVEGAPNDRAAKVVAKAYKQLSSEVTTNSLRVLIALRRARSNQAPQQVLAAVKPMVQRQEPNGLRFEQNLIYRLKFLCLLGLVRSVGSEFSLTELGRAFIDRAQQDEHSYAAAFT